MGEHWELTDEWRAIAACRKKPSDWFFPLRQNDPNIAQGKRVCKTCEVREPCLEFALAYRDEGIWGGTTETERNVIRALIGGRSFAEFRGEAKPS